MRALNILTLLLITIRGLNCSLVGLDDYDLVANILGGGGRTAILPTITCVLVGLSAVWRLMPLSRAFLEGETIAQRH